MNILMVCLGNICRSPLAEGIMQAKIDSRGLDWQVDSAGTGAWHIGEAPDPRSRQIARQEGLSIDHQRARQFTPADFDHFDLILTMDRSNFQNVLRLAGNDQQREKVRLILEMANPRQDADVPDPYWDDNGFRRVYDLLDDACDRILNQLETRVLDSSYE
ncbi:MAG: low molecular weight phosphotyrosine protein phosphatase [Lewinella sp.]|nr:low molecular weight phosphotyrosine protein phosphatase [Lewinella sp.]